MSRFQHIQGALKAALIGCSIGSQAAIAVAAPTDDAPREQAPIKMAQVEGEQVLPVPDAAAEDFFAFDVPVTLNEVYLGDISAEVTLSGYARILATDLSLLLAERLSETQAALLSGFGSEPVLLETLRERGFTAVYDPASLTIKINLPREGVEQISVRGRGIDSINQGELQQPAKLSAGMEVIARPRYVHENQNSETGFAPFAADMRGFLSFGGFENLSLTYELDFQEGRDSQIQRGDITLTRDDFRRAIRYQAGDIRPSISGFQSSFDVLGIGIERNYGAIQPFRNLRPGGRSVFTLERRARVTYEVNGAIVGAESLEAGQYDIRDFPVTTGANEVRVIIDDEFGTREAGSYSTFVDTELLASQTVLFGATAGLRRKSRSFGVGPDYDNKFVALGFLEKGISDAFTLGTQFEIGPEGGFIGGRSVYGLGSNVIAFEGAASKFEGFETGIASALRYSYRPFQSSNGNYSQLDAQISFQNSAFQTLGNNGQPRGENWGMALQNTFTRGLNSYTFSGAWDKTDIDELTTFGATLRRPIKGASISLGYRGVYRKSEDTLESRILLTLSKNFGRKGSFRSRLATGPNEAEIEWRRLSTRNVGALSGRASYLTSEIEDEFSADASYIMPRAEIDLGHVTRLENGGGPVISSVSDARIGVGFGFADGAFALGRPVSDGFFLLKTQKALKGKKVETYQGGDLKSGATDMFGATLVPLTGAYRRQTHRIDIADLPPGYDIGSGQVEIFPSFNSGYKVLIGADPSALVMGVLLNADGEPVPLTTGRLEPVSGQIDADNPIIFFTNRTGRFVAERVPAGRYKFIIMPDDRVIKEMDIGEGEDGVVRIGTIQMETP